MPPSRLARLIVRAYPPALRRTYGPDMAETLMARWREASGLRARLRLGGDLFADFAGAWRSATRWRMPATRSVLSDVRDALRLFRRAPLFGAGAVVTLALGIGTVTAIVGLADATVLRPLPIPDAGRVVQSTFSFSYPDFRDLVVEHRGLVQLSAWSYAQFAVERRGESIQVPGAGVSGAYFALAGQRAVAGRLIAADDDTEGAAARAVISERLWTRAFARDAGVIGATVLINRRPVTIVGISPAAFRGTSLQIAPELFVTLAHLPDLSPGFLSRPGTKTNRGMVFLTLAGRLPDGTTAAQAGTEARRIYYSHRPPGTEQDTGVWFTALLPQALGGRTEADLRRFISILLSAGALALLLACATVANLLLVRADRRRHELAVRAALGAGRWRLARLLLVESAGIGVAGGLLGAAAAALTIQLLGAYALPGQIAIQDLRLDVARPLLAGCAGLGLLTAVAFGLAPIWQARRLDAAAALKAGSRSVSRQPVRAALVGVQVALCVVLLGGSLAFGRAMAHALAFEFGFNVSETSITAINPSLARYSPERAADLRRRSLEVLRANPAIRGAAWALIRPMSGAFTLELVAEGGHSPTGPDQSVQANVVTDGYFETMQIPIERGRAFTSADLAGGERLAVVSTSLARQLWPSEDAVGRRFSQENPGSPDMKWVAVIGVVADIHRQVNGPAVPMLYLPDGQTPDGFSPDYLIVRAAGPGASVIPEIRATLGRLDPTVPITASAPMSRHVAGPLMAHRLGLTLLALFAGLASVLTAFGLYAVVATAVAQRTREIGIRVALGAEAGRVVRLVARQGLWPLSAGLAAGVATFVLSARFLTTFMFSLPVVNAAGVFTIAGAVTVLALLAMFVPARRALRVDPTVTLKAE